MSKIACYMRVSTDEQKVDLQKDAITNYLKFKGLHDAALFYVDQGESGSKESRPAFDEMLKAIDRGEIKAVVTWKFDRISRSTSQLIKLMNDLKDKGIDFVSIVEAIDTTSPIGKMIFTIFAALAEFERDNLIIRTNAGIKAAKDRGIHCGRSETIGQAVKEAIFNALIEGQDAKILADLHGVSVATVYRIKKRLT